MDLGDSEMNLPVFKEENKENDAPESPKKEEKQMPE